MCSLSGGVKEEKGTELLGPFAGTLFVSSAWDIQFITSFVL